MSQTDSIWTEKSVKVFVNEIGCFNNHRNLVNGDSNFVDSEYRLERDIMWFYMVSSLVFKRKKLEKVHNSCIQVWIIGMLSAYHTTICKYLRLYCLISHCLYRYCFDRNSRSVRTKINTNTHVKHKNSDLMKYCLTILIRIRTLLIHCRIFAKWRIKDVIVWQTQRDLV